MDNRAQANRAMDSHRHHKGAVEQKPHNRTLRAAQNLSRVQAALDRVDHHRQVPHHQRRHKHRGDPLQHIQSKRQHQRPLRKNDFAVSRFSPAIADIGSNSLGQ